MRTIATCMRAKLHAAVHVGLWAAHGSPMESMGCTRQPLLGLWSVHANWATVGAQVIDGRLKICSPRKEIFCIPNNCNLLAFLGWIKIVAIYFM